jgi:hypothetical protein
MGASAERQGADTCSRPGEAGVPGRSRLAVGDSESQPGGGGHRGCAAGVDGGDDLLGVDGLRINRGGAVVGVAGRLSSPSQTPGVASLTRVRKLAMGEERPRKEWCR